MLLTNRWMDRQTDGWIDRQTDGGDKNIPEAFLKKIVRIKK